MQAADCKGVIAESVSVLLKPSLAQLRCSFLAPAAPFAELRRFTTDFHGLMIAPKLNLQAKFIIAKSAVSRRRENLMGT